MGNVTGGNKLKRYLRNHAKRARQAGPVDVGFFDPENATKALRQEFGAVGADGQQTPESAFMRRAAGLGSRRDARQAARSEAKRGDLAAGLRAAGNVIAKRMKQNIREDDLIQTRKMHDAVKVREGG